VTAADGGGDAVPTATTAPPTATAPTAPPPAASAGPIPQAQYGSGQS